jgi:hypothetical protein
LSCKKIAEELVETSAILPENSYNFFKTSRSFGANLPIGEGSFGGEPVKN